MSQQGPLNLFNSSNVVTGIVGTNNQVFANGTYGIVETGEVTLTLPQDIATTSNVTFNKTVVSFFQLTTSPLNGAVLTSDALGNGSWTLLTPGVASITGTANQISASSSTGAVTLSFTDGISIGSYQATTPPTGGILAPGQISFGSSTVSTYNQFAVSTALAHSIYAEGTQTAVDASSYQSAFESHSFFNPTTGSQITSSFSASSNFNVPTGQTVNIAADFRSSPAFISNAGTINNFYGFFFDGGGSLAAGTISSSYGAYFTKPTSGTNKIALYATDVTVGDPSVVAPTDGIYCAGQEIIHTGGSSFGLSNTPSLILGVQNAVGGVIKLLGLDVSGYAIIQASTVNLHLDANNSSGAVLYLNHYATLANTYVQDSGGQIGLGTSTLTTGAVVTITGANATTSTKRSLYVTAPTGGSVTNQAIYSDDLTVGYTTGFPPLNGLLVSGQSSFGTTNNANAHVTIQNAATDYYNLYLQGTLVSYDANHSITNVYGAATLNPTLGATVASTYIANSSFISPSLQTITYGASYYSNPILSANVGTITTLGQFTSGPGSTLTGTLTNHAGFIAQAIGVGTNRYGGYFNAPVAGGTISAAVYADNIAIGSPVTPPSSTGLYVAGKVAIGTTTLGTDTLSNDLQLGTIGTTKGMSIAMTNTYARMREVATVNQFAITTNYSISPTGQDNTTYNSWVEYILSGATTTGSVTWNYAAPGSTTLNTYLAIDAKANLVLNNAAIATTATDGFLYITSCAGAPTGTPTSYTGRVPMVYDTTDNKLYIYNGGWKSATFA